MDTAIATTENRLLVQLTAKKFIPCNSLKEASAILRAHIAVKGISLSRWMGGDVLHPTKGRIAIVSPNGKIWLKGMNEKPFMTTWRDGDEPFGVLCSVTTASLTTNEL